MNIYVLVEGQSEKIVYRKWIPYVNPRLSYVTHPADLQSDNFSIVSGRGYPQYLERTGEAVEDVANNPGINRLVVSIDSEDMTLQEKYEEVDAVINSIGYNIDYRIIVQHFCLEVWALGHRRLVRPFPGSIKLNTFMNTYNVRESDPEGLPAYPEYEWNRAQFAYSYLREAFLDRYRRFTYTKKNPTEISKRHFFDELVARAGLTGHIASFLDFRNAFI